MNAPSLVPECRKQAGRPQGPSCWQRGGGLQGRQLKPQGSRWSPGPAREQPRARGRELGINHCGPRATGRCRKSGSDSRTKAERHEEGTSASLQHGASESEIKQQFPSLATGGVRPDETARLGSPVFIPSSVPWWSWVYLDVWFSCSLQRSWCQWARDFFLRNSTAGLMWTLHSFLIIILKMTFG